MLARTAISAADTQIGDVVGEQGYYHYRGRNAITLAEQCSFEQVWHWVVYGTLPAADSPELRAFQATVGQLRVLPDSLVELIVALARITGA